jgi:hypothetical protein
MYLGGDLVVPKWYFDSRVMAQSGNGVTFIALVLVVRSTLTVRR